MFQAFGAGTIVRKPAYECMSIDATKYPLALMATVQGQSQAIGEFIEDGLHGTRFFPILESTEQLLVRHFEVDLNAVERERRQVRAEFTQQALVRCGCPCRS